MTCYHPLIGLFRGFQPNGKMRIKILSKKAGYWIDKSQVLHWINYNGIEIQESKMPPDKSKDGYLLIPCGQCLGCRIDYSKQWATRMICECKYHDKACFVTLTYDDMHVPLSSYVDKNGELQESLTLRPDDLTRFWKRLRFHFPDVKIRYFAAGEYGETTHRPHYHAIIYGIDFSEDRELLKVVDGNAYWTSPTLEKIWQNGYVLIADVCYETCAYVGRYVTKKAGSSHKEYCEYFNIVPEFNRMSLKPAIGRQYYDDHKDEIFKHQEIFISGITGGKKLKPPRYYKQLYEIDNPAESKRICEDIMKMSDNISSAKLKHTSLCLLEMLAVEEQSFKDKIKALRRDKV